VEEAGKPYGAGMAELRDPLTGLGGPALFLDHLELALAASGREGRNAGVLAIALDDYQLIDNALGPDALEPTLAEIARRLALALRPGDTAAYLGAERFAAICPGVADARDLLAVAERVQAGVGERLEVSGRQLFPTVSVGMTLALGNETAPQLARDARAALDEALRLGSSSCQLFDPALRGRLLERLEVEHSLRHALVRDEFRVFYQPQFDTVSGQLVALEALVRWHHPERGLLEPLEFIGIAERSGLIVPLGTWVLREACRQAAEWSADEAADFRLAVNVSVAQLEQPDFVETVRECLAGSGLAPDRLCLELTETALMSRPDSALTVLSAVKDLGVRIAIDDFGIGFSSLRQLRDLLPIHQLKVDRSFISEMADDPHSLAIVAAVILMATSLGLEAVAEGVENAVQLDHLSALGCGISQGFLLGRPQPAQAIPELLGRPADAARG
jgi:diguanylate cyclase (GGDEF)-like protein